MLCPFAGKVCAYDWDLRRLGLTVEASNQLIIDQVFNGSVEAFNAAQIQQICDVAMTLCKGPNKQYNSKAECVKFLQSLPIGDWDRADQNNVVCRTLHALLVPVRPEVHCPHIGECKFVSTSQITPQKEACYSESGKAFLK